MSETVYPFRIPEDEVLVGLKTVKRPQPRQARIPEDYHCAREAKEHLLELITSRTYGVKSIDAAAALDPKDKTVQRVAAELFGCNVLDQDPNRFHLYQDTKNYLREAGHVPEDSSNRLVRVYFQTLDLAYSLAS